ncbi:MAG: 5-methyltetrahydropteroyltriglutamate--homocysteine methyltransferase [Rhodobacteraceae bacterium]|nr:5-methyltetrahydropteroyltriglutamate--homocysteine methyltransferase [Paracoccaceae bacterium]
MPIRTACLGAFPKPDYVPIKDWFHIDIGDDTYADQVVSNWTDDPEHDATFRRATEEVVKAQIECGISIPTDGEQRRENYVHYQCRHFTGFDFENLERRLLRNGAYDCYLPAIRGKISAGTNVLVRDYLEAQDASDRPVKITLPGPLTITDSTADCYYENDQRLALDLADALNADVRALAHAGCQHIQIDEPVFARKPEAALNFGVEALERCFHRVSGGVTRTMHMCCGYPDRLDNPDYPKADHAVYHALVEALDGRVDAISIEDCHCHNDLSLFEKFEKTTAIVGFVDVAVSQIEPVEEIIARMRQVLQVLPPHRLIGAPDCGLGFLGTDLTMKKLKNLCLAAQAV